MADAGTVRIRLPSTIRAGDVVRGRALVIHPMERLERDGQGRVVPRRYRYITRVVVSYLGHTVAEVDTTQSVSENPLLTFAFRATEPGPVVVTCVDTTGARYQGTAEVRFS